MVSFVRHIPRIQFNIAFRCIDTLCWQRYCYRVGNIKNPKEYTVLHNGSFYKMLLRKFRRDYIENFQFILNSLYTKLYIKSYR